MNFYPIKCLLSFSLVCFLGSPIWANICVPEPGEKLKVVGVKSDDTLNVREGYTTKYKVVTELSPNQDSIEYVDVIYKSEACSNLCANHLAVISKNGSVKDSRDRIKSECRSRSKIWYKILTNEGVHGWASAKYLEGYAVEQDSIQHDSSTQSGLVHLVSKGDTAYSISRKYGISLTELALLNDLDSNYSLTIGRTLIVSEDAKQVNLASSDQSEETEEGTGSPSNSTANNLQIQKKNSNSAQNDQPSPDQSYNAQTNTQVDTKLSVHKPFNVFGKTFDAEFSFVEACRRDAILFEDLEYLCYEESVPGTLRFDGWLPISLNPTKFENAVTVSILLADKTLEIQFYDLRLDTYYKQIQAGFGLVDLTGLESKYSGDLAKLEGRLGLPISNSSGDTGNVIVPFKAKYSEHEYINSLIVYPVLQNLGSENDLKSYFVSLPDDERKLLQFNLTRTGYYNGRVDGYWDKKIMRPLVMAIAENLDEIVKLKFKNKWERLWEKSLLHVLSYFMTDAFREKYDVEFAANERAKRTEIELNKQLTLAAAAKKKKEAERLRIENRKLAESNFEQKLLEFNAKYVENIENNFGFRDLIPGIKMAEVQNFCKGNLKISSTCYGLQDVKFVGTYKSIFINSQNFGGEQVRKEIKLLTALQVDQGPLTSSYISFSKDPNDGNILNAMRKTLEKYNLDYEYTERERELFNAGEKDKLIVVYEGGKVVLMIKKQTKDYVTQARLYIQYRDSDTAKKFYESNMPKRATSDDF